MPNTDKQEWVSALFADSDRGQCSAIRLYGSVQQAVEVCAAVTSGWHVLEILRGGLCPQVLVLDTLLQGPGLGELLWQLGTLDLPFRPRVLITAMPCTQQSASRFLTMGADCIIFKPYTMAELFAAVYRCGGSDEAWDSYRVREYLHELLCGMHYNRRLGGWNYLERILLRTVLGPDDYIAKELYQYAADGQHIRPGTVGSALQRINESLRHTGPQGYDRLCRVVDKPAGSRLSNLELIRSLTELIRRAMGR